MHFTYTVNVEVQRAYKAEEGKFASRDDLGEQLLEAIESANPDGLYGENGEIYSVEKWEVTE